MIDILIQAIFWLFVVLTVGSAIVVVFSKRIIYSAFALLFTLIGVAGLYVFLAADFLAASQMLIYVGGILTLIIFGVFLTAKIYGMTIPDQAHQRYLALLPVAGFAAVLIHVLFSADWNLLQSTAEPTTENLGKLLLTTYLVPFEVASVLLLAALIGAMRISRPREEDDDR
ncbi:NADH-quinone oxidoreductase subunit J [candidate division LCP-89 bacterium B3_LCP]|uniref:NADH-quinone oxidoreductase subunit J n=1 Tax=candidate division LCP-89 bacterium B3_LCP TaxID=2012998 RepID=A0A532V5V3_UNCL8|nr:MAG: NADH-quinone oxidoreductase subunit J [candidate division LCP-89 bacterium B3_LCP]